MFELAFATGLAVAAPMDVAARRVPNWLNVAILLGGLIAAGVMGQWRGLAAGLGGALIAQMEAGERGMRRVRFQLSAWKSHRPLAIPAKSPVAGCEPPRRDTPRCNLGRARQMRPGRCRGRITCVRTQRRRGALAEVGRVRWVEWRESAPARWGEVSPDQTRGCFSDQKVGSFGQDGRRCAARTRQAVFRAAVPCSRVVMIGLEIGFERGQDRQS